MKNNPTIDEWLGKLPPDLQRITRELIAIARKNMPGVHEYIYHDVMGYSVNDSLFDRVCYIAPQKNGYVKFGFFFVAGLPDPKKLLTGEGKRLRYVKIWSVEEVKNPALAKLVSTTWKQAPQSVAAVHKSMNKAKSG